MRKTLIATGMILASFSAAHVNAQQTMSNFSYDYAEARIGISPLTYGAGFSKSIHPNAHIVGSIDTEFDSDWDAALGVGFHAPINNWADVTGELKARNTKNKGRFDSSAGKMGMEVNLGIRQWLGPQLEVGGSIGHLNIDDYEKTIGNIYARFHATELFSIGATGRFNEVYGDQVMLTTRFKF
ncbi:hypothetical protein C9I98_19960 [Photobacterium sanctipauli]|uniref:Outer membrane protein beta-barrel domain-containing protein n=1 Tax=Photobacterium sanctipauli TaxID=1342794 RepID=A0A2T3NNK2_9GAMM|nr:hypothetical protein [Photobacterium sanctipauli]PSW17278.1 hypothetical protein C9I98_19960 [Photobacterium sanctipauli]